MPGPATILRELHRLRRHLRDLQAELERAPRVLKARQAKLAQEEETFKEAQEAIKRLKIGTHEKEVSLKATHQQIAKYEKQLDDVANKKEYDAKQVEIVHSRERTAELENQILEAMSESEERAARLPEQEKHLHQARAQFAEFEAAHRDRVARLEDEKRRTQEELKATEAQIPDKIRPEYQRLVNAYGADALAAVNGQACSHCRTHVTAQQQAMLEQELYVVCKSCGRALYLPEPARGVG